MLDRAQSVCNRHGSPRLHEPLQGILYQPLTLRVQGRRRLVQDQYRWVLQDRPRNTHALSLSATQSATPVSDIRVKSLFTLHDKLIRIRNLRCLLNLFLCGMLHTERDIIPKRIIKQDCLLVHIPDQLSQVMNPQVFHVYPVYQHFSLHHIIIPRYQVHQCRFSRSALSHYRHRLPLRNNKVYVF